MMGAESWLTLGRSGCAHVQLRGRETCMCHGETGVGRFLCEYPRMNDARAQVYLITHTPRCCHGIFEHVNVCMEEYESLCNTMLSGYTDKYRETSFNK